MTDFRAGGLASPFRAPGSPRWIPQQHPLGRGAFHRANVRVAGGELRLALPAGTHDGAEVRSRERFGYGTYEAWMRTPLAPGSISALFLYQGSEHSDEIDVEIHNDGSRRVMLTTWVAGRQTHSATLRLPFDPAEAPHAYRIEWAPDRVRFVADGRPLRQWRRQLPHSPMYLMASAWWPAWLAGPPPGGTRWLALSRVVAAPEPHGKTRDARA